MERTILHCDCNSFFASVETVAHPEYASLPMAVCGSEEERHGIVLAKNELAKKCGIKTGEVIWSAKLKCPNLVIARPSYGVYGEYSRAINDIYYEYTDRVEPFGIDESWLDVTGSARLFGDGKKIADTLRARIKKELGITISAGVSFTKSFAKLGSDYKKPDATTVIPYRSFRDIVFPLPASDMLFVGRRTSEKLRMLGINTIGQLARSDISFLEDNFGKVGRSMHAIANGEDMSEVAVAGQQAREKSIGNGFTFRRDIESEDDARYALTVICDEVGARMRKAKVKCRVVTLWMRDTHLSVTTRQTRINPPTDLSRVLSETAFSLLAANWDMRTPLRSVTVIGSDFIDVSRCCEQMKLFYTDGELKAQKLEALETAVDSVRARYGENALLPCSRICNIFGM